MRRLNSDGYVQLDVHADVYDAVLLLLRMVRSKTVVFVALDRLLVLGVNEQHEDRRSIDVAGGDVLEMVEDLLGVLDARLGTAPERLLNGHVRDDVERL